MLGDVGFRFANGQNQAAGPTRIHRDGAVPEEVADELSELLCWHLRDANPCRVVVRLELERRELEVLDRQVCLLLKGNPIAHFDVLDSLPDVLAVFVDDSEPVLECRARRVAMPCADAPHRRNAVVVELLGLFRPLVSRHGEGVFVAVPRVRGS